MSDKTKSLAELAAEIASFESKRATDAAAAMDQQKARREATSEALPAAKAAYDQAVKKAGAELAPSGIKLQPFTAQAFAPSGFSEKLEIVREGSAATFGTMHTDITHIGQVSVVMSARIGREVEKEAVAFDISEMTEDRITEALTQFVALYSKLLNRTRR